MRCLTLFLLFFSLNISAQQSLRTDYSTHPPSDAKKYNIATRKIISDPCTEQKTPQTTDTVSETYNRSGDLLALDYFWAQSFSSHRFATHHFIYDDQRRITSDTTYLSSPGGESPPRIIIKTYEYKSGGGKVTMHTTPSWNDSSETVIILYENHQVISKTRIDHRGDTVYTYTKKGNTEIEIWPKRGEGIREREIRVTYPEERHVYISRYYADCDQYVTQTEEQTLDSIGRVVQKDVYTNGTFLTDRFSYVYSSTGLLLQKSWIDFTDSIPTPYVEKHIYNESGALTETQEFAHGDSEPPWRYTYYAYNEQGLLTGMRKVTAWHMGNGLKGECWKVVYRFY